VYSREEIEAAGLDDFRVFLAEVWNYLGLPKPTKVQYDMAYNLQNAPDKFCIEAFRGVGKSWILVAFVLWNLFLNPQINVMVVSASQGLADNFSTFCKQLIGGMPLLQFLQARQGQRDSNIQFDVGPARENKDPSVKSVGITGQLTGSRADIIIVDDVEVPKNSQTVIMRERLGDLVKECGAVIKPKGRIIYLGTPQVEESLYNKLPERGYTVRIWPAEIPKDPTVYHGRLAPYVQRMIAAGALPGTPVDPQRFDSEELAIRRAEYGRAGYALQYMLDTSLTDIEKHPLKLRDLIVHDVDADMGHVKLAWSNEREYTIQDLHAGGYDGDRYQRPLFKSPEMAKYTGTVMAIDPSGQGTDETAYAIVKILFGQLYLVEVGGFKDGFAEETLMALAAAALRHGVNYVIAEKNYGGGMFNNLLKPHLTRLKAGAFDEDWKGWSTGQKELRLLDTLEPLVASHRLTVARKVIEDDLKLQQESPQYSFVYQFTRMSRQKDAVRHDDRLEAVAMACSYWTERMSRDQDAAHKAHQQTLKEKALREHMEHCLGSKSKKGFRYHSTYH
jgi:hypothetical protein